MTLVERRIDQPASPHTVDYTVVVPTIGRPSLGNLLEALASGDGPNPNSVLLVDDRPAPDGALPMGRWVPSPQILRSYGRGPAAARNVGWRAATTPWVCFLDDDVVPDDQWRKLLVADLADLPWQVAASQGRVQVPRPPGRRPTDWERNTINLEGSRWITADMAYRREVLAEVGGFDERFTRAYREDADLGLRVTGAGYLIVQGERQVQHPVRPADRWASIRAQRGNYDDSLMRARHGTGWRAAADAGPSRNGRHLLATSALGAMLAAAVTGRHRAAGAAGLAWLASTGSFAWRRIAPGPKMSSEIITMVATSAAIPPVATWHTWRGWLRLPSRLNDTARAPLGVTRPPLALDPPRILTPPSMRPRWARADVGWRPELVLFDRDGTLIVDVPANGDPERVVAMPGARAAVRRAREEGLRVGVVTNQAAVGVGVVSHAEMEAVNGALDDLFGPFDIWQICPHTADDRCGCRKPAPGLIEAAARAVGVDTQACVVVGDIGSDIEAAAAAGARSVLVPTRVTRAKEIASAPVVAPNLARAVDLILAGMC